MSQIFDLANGISLDRYPNIASAVSIGGIARTQRTGLSFFYASCSHPPMYEDKFRLISNELLGLEDGVSTLTTTIPHAHTTVLGTWAGTPLVSSSNGRNVAIKGLAGSTNNIIQAGDWVSFGGGTKVYQVTGTVNSLGDGTATINVHTDFVTQPVNDESISFGTAVEFKFLMTSKPRIISIPGLRGLPLYSFDGEFVFREVL